MMIGMMNSKTMNISMTNQLAASFIEPKWPAPKNVRAIQTTRIGGVSGAPFDSLNLGTHVSDQPIAVLRNRQLLSQFMPTEPVWLNQTHSIDVIDAAKIRCIENADASYTIQTNVVCVAMTADCLPILVCDKAGTVVSAIHAGWRGLCDGIIESAIALMPVERTSLMCWLGPAIGPNAFEVSDDVRDQFIAVNHLSANAFRPIKDHKWFANIYDLAIQRLNALGIMNIYGGWQDEQFCTYSDQARFFSYRRDQVTGRMGSFIWLTDA